jgi:hypothetical protein
MEAIVMFLVRGFVALGLGALRFGIDSRDQLPDTHAR